MGLKQLLKRFFNLNFRYKCIECGKGHDGLIISMEGGFSNVRDFCSFKCAQNYIFKKGYSFKKRIINEKDKCIVCNKEHPNQFINEKQGYSTRAFCSKKCLNNANKEISPKIKNKEYKKKFKEMLDLFKKGKTRKDLKKGKMHRFENLKIDMKDLLSKR